MFFDRVIISSAKLLFILPLFVFALFVNGAIPGALTPTLGQAVWITGFAKSLASASGFSIFAYDIGIPESAAIAFGLPGALVTAVGLKAGLAPPDAYSLACMFWLTIAFWGAYRFCRYLGCSALYSAFGATIWLTFPIVWQHTGYSMLSIGIALLPTYYFSFLRMIDVVDFRTVSFAAKYSFFTFLCIVSAFMDGYTFVMFASACVATVFFRGVHERTIPINALKAAFALLGFLIAFLLYSAYVPGGKFRSSIDFFRGWGVDVSFLIFPPKGFLWFPDLIRASADREPAHLFGDASVFLTTFSLIPIVLSVVFLISPYGNKRHKILLWGIGLISLYLALGPSIKINSVRPEGVSQLMSEEYAIGPTGTRFLWEHVPGLYSMRAVYRWTALALVGFWGAIMVALADRRLPKKYAYAAVLTLLVFSFPYPKPLWSQYSLNRSSFLQMDDDISRELGHVFRTNETVAFLPTGNDFLINFLAPRLNIRSYNIGGDKNASIATAHWPPEVQRAARARTPEALAMGILEALNGFADTVAVPYLDLLWAAHRWPYPLDRLEEVKPIVQVLRQSALFDVIDTRYFAVIRLSTTASTTPHEVRHEILTSTLCLGASRFQLAGSTPLHFSDRKSLCGAGWSGVEKWGRWTDGSRASLYYLLPEAADGRILEFDVQAYLGGNPPQQRVKVRVNDVPAPDWTFTQEVNKQIKKIEIPADAKELKIEFDFPDARSPKQAGRSSDNRQLGIGVSAVCLIEKEKACLTMER